MTDKEFEEFTTMAYGYRAAWKLMETYRLRQEGKSYTLENIIHRWEPPEDGNDTTAYLSTVIRLLDYKVAGRQPLPSPRTKEGHRVFARILMAMTCMECGIRPTEVDRESIERGWELATSGPCGTNFQTQMTQIARIKVGPCGAPPLSDE